MTALALPAFGAFNAPNEWQAIDFISDLHLAADTPLGFEAWARYMRGTRADAVLILGDLFEVWVGDDARFEGFEAQCVEVLREAAALRSVAFMLGNRDFLVGADMLAACNVSALADPTVVTAFGERLLLTHGDALCLADTDYQRFRSMVRSPAWQASVLARPLAERRALAREVRHESERRHGTMQPEWLDLDLTESVEWMRAADTPVLVHGHTHRPADQLLQPGLTRHVLSDWDLDHAATPRADVLRWSRDGLRRIAPQDAG
ncbi:MAG: UDP-2,3-diacylglucosamine diphosphatase [Burkholderiaceae bacterium]